MCHFQETFFLLEKDLFGIRNTGSYNGLETILKLSQILPHPHLRRQQKSPARGQNKKRKRVCLMTLYDFYGLYGKFEIVIRKSSKR